MEMQIELYESPQKEANEDKYGLMSNHCICCGKPMKEGESKLVHMNTYGMVMHNSIIEESDAEIHGYQSQGYFPIGNSCAKKMNKEYIHE
jgi:hypothetical protein